MPNLVSHHQQHARHETQHACLASALFVQLCMYCMVIFIYLEIGAKRESRCNQPAVAASYRSHHIYSLANYVSYHENLERTTTATCVITSANVSSLKPTPISSVFPSIYSGLVDRFPFPGGGSRRPHPLAASAEARCRARGAAGFLHQMQYKFAGRLRTPLVAGLASLIWASTAESAR
ncbi:hypothetical protein M441DRAFT_318400 [Trichoderma asperellum CBS 433.97]|uniref:Uncharacterized protein n=1 Tax=Trichoderma asperellum (strain ATCC 204424 / CBS 433.97 / NBRC 101777) TaxID=1042311 RepID=A0A2T3ZL13_TRIA4|nr:hypothetical protein M441DRAFT_318400 [Trichoderma asperellum CBS 433.97]PTB45486.1 hypothetical protein M441DRAFT_318400 [Trichoderma asperellum CBS 433.97]